MSAAPKVKDSLKFDIEVIKGPHIGLKLSFEKGVVSIGRGPENDLVLASDPRVSRAHAEIRQRGADFVIVNLSQKNFVLVNGENVQSEVLTANMLVQIGDTEFRFIPPIVPSTPEPVAPQGMVQNVPANPAILNPQSGTPVLRPQAPPPGMPSPPPVRPHAGGQPQGARASASRQARPHSPPSSGIDPRVRFYGIVVIIGLVGWFLLSPSKNGAKKDPNEIRTSVISLQDVAEAEKRTQELLTIKKEKYDSVQYRRAQENFIKGFRDFQQGQYARARESFQVVLNLDPENELAKRYYSLSKIKFDELVKFNMIQGNRYREKKNWRMCQSNYSNVMTMLQNRKDDPTYKEAKQFYDECTLNLEGRF